VAACFGLGVVSVLFLPLLSCLFNEYKSAFVFHLFGWCVLLSLCGVDTEITNLEKVDRVNSVSFTKRDDAGREVGFTKNFVNKHGQSNTCIIIVERATWK